MLEVKDNRKRKRIHGLKEKIVTDRIRLAIESTNDSQRAEVLEIRVYEDAHQQLGNLLHLHS